MYRRSLQLSITFLLLLSSTVVLTGAFSSWWASRQNHLFGTGRWQAGKDTGKFVFYTYGFLFEPLKKERIDLASHMGYQQIRYREVETRERRLTRLAFETAITNESYLWVILHAGESGQTRLRISNSERHRNGVYRYGPDGALLAFSPFDEPLPVSESWRRILLERRGQSWHLSRNKKPLAVFPVPESPGGWFGFQGSGRARAHVYVRKIDLTWQSASGRTETVKERFSQQGLQGKALAAVLGISLVFSLLRLTRSWLLAGIFGLRNGRTWILLDHGLFTLLVFAGWQWAFSKHGEHLVGAFALSELATIILLASGRSRADARREPGLAGISWLVVSGLLLLSAAWRHGEWFSRAERQIWSKMEQIDPAAFHLLPDPHLRGKGVTEAALNIIPGQPWFAGGAYRDQEIRFDCRFDGPATLDLVFQQQAYQTRGDPKGEPLPLQRRLLRLSTYPGVTSGLASGLHKQPAPFDRLKGALRPNDLNTVRLRIQGQQLEIELNGEVSRLPSPSSLGFGETGLMSFEPGVHVTKLQITPLDARMRGLNGQVVGILMLLAGLPAVALLARRRHENRYRLLLVCIAGMSFLPAALGTYSLLLSSDQLAYMGYSRLIWLDLLLLGVVASLSATWLLPDMRRRTRLILFNLWFLLVFATGTLIAYDRLPAEHPLRARRDAVAPASAGLNAGQKLQPWYAQNVSIGASTFIWHQRFGTKSALRNKPDGVLRVFTLGGSQAWGSGASDSFNTYDALLERKLKKRGHRVEVYNAAVNGAGIRQVRDHYLQLVRHYQPDLLILDIGLNDSASLMQDRGTTKERHRQRLIEAYESLLESCEKDGVRLILVQEAMSRESSLRPDAGLYMAYVERARHRGHAVIDALKETVRLEDDHAVWWDTAHLAPFGHQLLARLLERPVADVLVQAEAP